MSAILRRLGKLTDHCRCLIASSCTRSLPGSFRYKWPKACARRDLLGIDEVSAELQFVYLLLVGSFPFNSFLAGFFSCVGFFVLTGEQTKVYGLAHFSI